MSIFHFMFDHDGDGELNFWEASECDMWINQHFFSDDDDDNSTSCFVNRNVSSYDPLPGSRDEMHNKSYTCETDRYDNYYSADDLIEIHGCKDYELKEYAEHDDESIYPYFFEDFYPEFRSRMFRRKYDANYPEGCGVEIDRNNKYYQKFIARGFYDCMLHISGFFDMNDVEKENFYRRHYPNDDNVKSENN